MTDPVHLGELWVKSTGRAGLNEIRAYARSQAINPVETLDADWAKRVASERWAVDAVLPDGNIMNIIFDGSFGWPLNTDREVWQ